MARTVCYTLALLHWVLPFTPFNPSPAPGIRITSVLLGSVFLACALLSLRDQRRWFTAALALLLTVFALGAITGISPLQDGWLIKALLAAGLAWGIWKALPRSPQL